MSQQPAPAALRHRILGAFPAGHYALDSLLRLFDLVLDDEVASAAVECRTLPRLLLNPAFLAAHCQSDEHLAMLVLHEIHHVLLGHTRLFPRASAAQNLAFDAVINATLCHMFPAPAYRGFFEALNPPDRAPECLLRPPPGWPANPCPPATLPHALRELWLALYGEAGVGYAELFRRIEHCPAAHPAEAPCASPGDGACARPSGAGAVLLGDHGSEEGRAGRALDAARAPALLAAIRAVVERWPMPPDPIRGRSVGGELRSSLLGARGEAHAAVALLRRMFRRLALAAAGAAPRLRLAARDRRAETALPQLRDRRAVVRGLLGAPPLLFQSELPQPAPAPAPARVHVYLDVSGSTAPYQPDLFAAVRPHVARRRCVVHAFSERVVDLDRRALARGEVRSTGGTHIACVTEHLVRHRITRALILTDGYVGPIPPDHRDWLTRHRAVLDVALTPEGWREDLRGAVRDFVELPRKTQRSQP